MLKPADIGSFDYITVVSYHQAICKSHGVVLSPAGQLALAKVIRNNLEELILDSTVIVKRALEKAKLEIL